MHGSNPNYLVVVNCQGASFETELELELTEGCKYNVHVHVPFHTGETRDSDSLFVSMNREE